MAFINSLPIVSSIVMFVFAGSVFQRFFVRRNPAFLFWGIGLLMFALSSLSEIILHFTWSPIAFAAWYVLGAALTAAWIGQGTLHLLVRRSWVHSTTALLIAASFTVIYLMTTTPLNPDSFDTATPVSQQYAAILGSAAPIRSTTPIFNVYGLFTLVGGAIYSGYLFWRKRVLPNRVAGNVLIAVGGLSISAAGLLTRLGYGQFLYIGELAAATTMYAGFRMAAAPQAGTKQTAPPEVAPATKHEVTVER